MNISNIQSASVQKPASYQPNETSRNHPVQCRWVPGTLDRVKVSDSLTHQNVVLDLHDFLQLVDREAVNALHLQGLAQLECDQTQWDVFEALQVTQWNDSAPYL